MVVVVVALFYVFRQPEAAKDGPGLTPWQAYYTQRQRKYKGTLAPRAHAPQGTLGCSTVARAGEKKKKKKQTGIALLLPFVKGPN